MLIVALFLFGGADLTRDSHGGSCLEMPSCRWFFLQKPPEKFIPRPANPEPRNNDNLIVVSRLAAPFEAQPLSYCCAAKRQH